MNPPSVVTRSTSSAPRAGVAAGDGDGDAAGVWSGGVAVGDAPGDAAGAAEQATSRPPRVMRAAMAMAGLRVDTGPPSSASSGAGIAAPVAASTHCRGAGFPPVAARGPAQILDLRSTLPCMALAAVP